MSEHENLPKEDVSPKENHSKAEHKQEAKAEKQPWHKQPWNTTWTPKSAAFGGFLTGVLLVTVVWIVVSHVHNQDRRMMPYYNSYINSQGMRPGMPYMAMDRDVNQMRMINNRMMGNLNMVATNAKPGPIVDSSGTMAFYLNGNKLELPYTVKDKKLNITVKSLTDFITANPTDKVVFNFSSSDGKSISNFTTAQDFGGDQLNYDLSDGLRYIIKLDVTDDKGNQIVNASQVI